MEFLDFYHLFLFFIFNFYLIFFYFLLTFWIEGTDVTTKRLPRLLLDNKNGLKVANTAN